MASCKRTGNGLTLKILPWLASIRVQKKYYRCKLKYILFTLNTRARWEGDRGPARAAVSSHQNARPVGILVLEASPGGVGSGLRGSQLLRASVDASCQDRPQLPTERSMGWKLYEYTCSTNCRSRIRRPRSAEVVGMSQALADLPPELAEAVTKFARQVNGIEELVNKLRSAPWSEICRGLSPLESARLHLMVAYTINTLFYSVCLPYASLALRASKASTTVYVSPPVAVMLRRSTLYAEMSPLPTPTVYLKTQGVSPVGHPVQGELVSTAPQQQHGR